MTVSEQTLIELTYGDIEGEFTYKVVPYLYYSSPGGYLVLDYLTVIPSNSFPPTFWERTYTKPDPTFNLPYLDLVDNAEKELSKDVRIGGTNLDDPKEGDTFEIGVRIKNFSPFAVSGLQIRYYQVISRMLL